MLVGRWRAVLAQANDLQNDPFPQAAVRLTASLSDLAMRTVLPLLVLVLAAAIVGSVIANQGVVLSFEPLKPKLSHLDPVKGFGRLFALKAFVEPAKTMIKGGLLGTSLVIVVIGTWRSLILMPGCGMGCFEVVIAAWVCPARTSSSGAARSPSACATWPARSARPSWSAGHAGRTRR